MKRSAKLVVVPFWFGLGVVAALPVPANAATTCLGKIVASDLHYTTSGFGSPTMGTAFTPGTSVGGSFRTGATATNLKGVSFAAVATGSTNGYVNVDIWSDNGTGAAPGHSIALIKRHVVIGAYSAITPLYVVTAKPATTAPDIPLAASTRYWIVLSDASDAPLTVPATTWQGAPSTLIPATTNVDPGYSVGTAATGTWTSSAALAALTPFLEVRAC